jgi:hypothetical protein
MEPIDLAKLLGRNEETKNAELNNTIAFLNDAISVAVLARRTSVTSQFNVSNEEIATEVCLKFQNTESYRVKILKWNTLETVLGKLCIVDIEISW